MRRSLIAAFAALVMVGSGVTPALATSAPALDLDTGATQQASKENPNKIDIMGMWAHPDDDAGFNTPCGIWAELEGLKCGIIMVTRGEGGSNSVGSEAGPDLGLRRENEDRLSHKVVGTTDIFNLDRVDFFYNTSAPLTAQAWDQEETLRRAVRVVRETQPEIMTSWTPSLAAGHGNHQDAARLMRETVQAAADPTMFPEQLTGPNALETWQVKRTLEDYWGFLTGAANPTTQKSQDCMAPSTQLPTSAYPLVGLWTGYESPDTWSEGNVQGQPAGSHKTWAQVGAEGAAVHATQARVMKKDVANPSCKVWTMSWSMSPFQPESKALGKNDRSALYGAAIDDPGGFPAGSTFYATPETFRVGQGQTFEVTAKIAASKGTLPDGAVSLEVPDGWTVSGPQSVTRISTKVQQRTFTVTAAADADLKETRLSLHFKGGGKKAYNETTVLPTPAVEGQFARWGNTAEYDQWTSEHQVYSGGVSPALDRIGAGESMTLPVEVTNRSTEPASGQAKLTMPEDGSIVAEDDTLDFTDLAPGATEKLDFTITHTDPTAAGGTNATIKLDTTSGSIASTENLNLYVVPTAVIPELSEAPALDGDDSVYGDALDISRKWEGEDCKSAADCGAGSEAKVGWYGDDLYVWAKVIDDTASSAATPDRCFGHWLVDSLEILLDPSGRSDDTSTTFKLGVFPFTDDADDYNGNGVNGPCWSRDADNHQGFSTGPLADKVVDAPNAPGVEVFASAEHPDGKYVDGQWLVEVKIPLKDLPAEVGPTSDAPTGDLDTNKVDPRYVGMNLTPYDSDTQDFIGQTRLAWSPFGSQQSEPYRWGHAYLDGYQGNGLSDEADKALIPQTALQSYASPETIYQSAARGVTIAGLNPSDAVSISGGTVTSKSIDLAVKAKGSANGTLRAYVWKGDPSYVPVWTSSCAGDIYGVNVCSAEDGKARSWSTAGMGGHVLASASGPVSAGKLSIPLSADAIAKLGTDVQVLVSYATDGVTSATGGVDAWAIPLKKAVAAATSATVGKIVYNSNGKVTVTVKAKGTSAKPSGTAKVTINGKSYSGKVAAGKMTFKPSKLIPVGSRAKVTFTSSDRNHFANSSTTVKLSVAKAAPKVAAKLAKSKVNTSAHAKVGVSVTIPGKLHAKAAKFTVKVYDGAKRVGAATLNSSGKAKVTLPKLKKGTHKITVKVLSTKNTKSASSKTLKLKVVR